MAIHKCLRLQYFTRPPDCGKCGGGELKEVPARGRYFIFPTTDINNCACQTNLGQVAIWKLY